MQPEMASPITSIQLLPAGHLPCLQGGLLCQCICSRLLRLGAPGQSILLLPWLQVVSTQAIVLLLLGWRMLHLPKQGI